MGDFQNSQVTVQGLALLLAVFRLSSFHAKELINWIMDYDQFLKN
jgi:hypothetical protein